MKHMIKCWWMAMVMNYETMRRKVDMAAMGVVGDMVFKDVHKNFVGMFWGDLWLNTAQESYRHSKRDHMATCLIMVTLP